MAPIDLGRDHCHFPQGFWAVGARFQREAGRKALAT
jgi:hypothetical protein